MSGKRQKIQYSLALEPVGQGETPVSGYQGTEPFVAKPTSESPAAGQLMEEVCERENLVRAWKRVRRNKGSPGVDGMTIDDAKDYLREHWPGIRSQLLAGTYQPQPVKRVEIPKPDGGFRKLSVPCVVDRLIQQALLRVLQERWDPRRIKHKTRTIERNHAIKAEVTFCVRGVSGPPCGVPSSTGLTKPP